jgi:hypothetical protein
MKIYIIANLKKAFTVQTYPEQYEQSVEEKQYESRRNRVNSPSVKMDVIKQIPENVVINTNLVLRGIDKDKTDKIKTILKSKNIIAINDDGQIWSGYITENPERIKLAYKSMKNENEGYYLSDKNLIIENDRVYIN